MISNEQFRAECEARYWLSRGYTEASRTQVLHDLISAKRGVKAADYLIENMRKEWVRANDKKVK